MNAYEAKLEARRERLAAKAARLAAEGRARIRRAEEISSHIPFGQPILVGHHSERRHRADIGRINGNYEKGYAALQAAGEAAHRAENVGQHGISSDDPEAVQKLLAELATIEAEQARMKAANAAIRKNKADPVPALVALGFSERVAIELAKPDFCGRIGFADYRLTNNSANGRRIRKRIEELRAKATEEHKETEVAGVQIIENVEENRLQLVFPGKPAPAVIAALKGHGFRWSPTFGAWQRQLNNSARYAAERVLAALDAGPAS